MQLLYSSVFLFIETDEYLQDIFCMLHNMIFCFFYVDLYLFESSFLKLH